MLFKKAVSTLMLSALCASMAAQADVKVGVVTSSTGPIALVGIPQKNSVALMPKKVGDQNITYISLDDGSDPTASVKAFKKLIDEEHVDAIIGPSGSPNAMGVIQFAAESGTPMLAPTGSAAVVLPMTEQKKWVFKTTQNDDLIAQALVEHMVKTGVKTLGLIGTADPYGENWGKVMTALAEKNGIKIVANERFQRQDTSTTGQSLKILMAKPDAVLVAAPGSSAVLPQTTLFDQGYKGQVYQTHGAALPPFLQLGGRKVEGTILAASLMLVIDEVPDDHPSKSVARKYIDDYTQLNGSAPATFGANVYDAGLLLEHAIPTALQKGKPGTAEFRSALRDALEQTHELAATQGVYNMSPEDHSGFDKRGRELITVKDGKWVLLK
ncbi:MULTISPECIES: ABC transporter substrate-binding protein [Pseudomonas]|jgi:branched-chain amino acid transport system substrate-binding protein|uniref:ABC transporter substrate-binding protein n=2 Tax=Pseudomonas veronii TaxID=76761 RepID=A0A7Y1AAA9_PSEVE|nr:MULTISPECIES: ABC transporter substrate-binding protein [Pseudomonas]MBI6556859.1 ABC transporter substrate-binding protein [Pseudomonas veronii]MBI6651860.1 ABC transporter substrate-binding protein [Pseudomonas veronii]MBJ2176626.1 ABC transporter substrate-binding protein [Pseudomonas veronii]MCI1736759.1 ABC transporter substrate-binding protein [Pseudomonas veronii]MDF3239415.1 ABC transporter substrate-binding protein [Pseudomonas veronii]